MDEQAFEIKAVILLCSSMFTLGPYVWSGRNVSEKSFMLTLGLGKGAPCSPMYGQNSSMYALHQGEATLCPLSTLCLGVVALCSPYVWP